MLAPDEGDVFCKAFSPGTGGKQRRLEWMLSDIIVAVALLISFSLTLHPIIFEQIYPSGRELFLPITLLLLTGSFIVSVVERKQLLDAKTVKRIKIALSVMLVAVAVIAIVERFFLPFSP